MEFTDDQLLLLIEAGMTDDEIIAHVHENTSPADLYGSVAEVVTNILHGHGPTLKLIQESEDSAIMDLLATVNAISENDDLMEVVQWWKDMGLTRSDTKNIVMTFLYGSTEYGNRDGINERIEKRAEECMEKGLDAYWDRSGADLYKDQRTMAVTIMVRLTRGAMAIACPSTVATMSWIQQVAEMLGERDIPMRWKTFLGFEVVQDNPNTRMKQIYHYVKRKLVSSLSIKVAVTDGKKYSSKKMAAGSAPNFVHSWDACHLQLVALFTESKYFHMIHDSMATQVADTPRMAYWLRETFCMMYEDADVLFEVWEMNKGDELSLPEPAPLGDFDVGLVRKSLYFFH